MDPSFFFFFLTEKEGLPIGTLSLLFSFNGVHFYCCFVQPFFFCVLKVALAVKILNLKSYLVCTSIRYIQYCKSEMCSFKKEVHVKVFLDDIDDTGL